MFSPKSIILLQTCALAAISSAFAQYIPSTLNVTTVAARNNISTLECWALQPGFIRSTQPGTIGSAMTPMGLLGNGSYSILPPRFNGGRHNAPAKQWVIWLSGLAHITLPYSSDEAWVLGGEHGALLFLDTADVSAEGHYTDYPSDEVTISLQIPFAEDNPPEHRVLHMGAWKGVNFNIGGKPATEDHLYKWIARRPENPPWLGVLLLPQLGAGNAENAMQEIADEDVPNQPGAQMESALQAAREAEMTDEIRTLFRQLLRNAMARAVMETELRDKTAEILKSLQGIAVVERYWQRHETGTLLQ
ncbi:hypothetical protein VTN00DRAFT_2339 [Thermoascus crustaceus]|uniref:uncharacterized protein n=1 Tax=Thermoascus crustaceus TaxID=5088 RepID=UPI0037438645